MRIPLRTLRSAAGAAAPLALLVGLALPGGAVAAPNPPNASKAPKAPKATKPQKAPGTLTQLPGKRGCLVDSSAKVKAKGCGSARALMGAGPFMGSRAVAISGDGKNVYVASSKSDAIAIFARDQQTGALTQAAGRGGCIAAKGAGACAKAIGLNGPNSVALSPDEHFLYATSRAADSVTIFHRNSKTGALIQLPPGVGCVAGIPIPGCAVGRALLGPDVVVVSPDGASVYVGSFFGNAVAIFQRARNGVLYQATDSSGCIAEATSGCAPGVALGAPEGMAISPDGSSVYVASALSNAVVELARDPSTGALSQATDGHGCIVDVPLTGCTIGVQLSGANAVTTSPAGRDVYVTSLLSNSVTSFSRSAAGILTQKPGTYACLVYLRAVGCSFGRAMIAPEGLAVSPDGSSMYVASFVTGAIDVLDRERESGILAQKPGPAGCLAPRSLPGCSRGRALKGVSSIAVSPDGRNVYSTSFGSNAVDVFRRNR
jgi:DNA-binding beta-propeller fold protein YncE